MPACAEDEVASGASHEATSIEVASTWIQVASEPGASMIRLAELNDIPRIVDLGIASLKDGPYSYAKADVPRIAELAKQIIEKYGFVLVWEEDDTKEVTGLIGVVISDHFFTGERTAQEIMWYVLPEHRKGAPSLRLFWEAEKIAKNRGAKKMQFTAPTEEIGGIYTRFGYNRFEVAYQKDLECHS